MKAEKRNFAFIVRHGDECVVPLPDRCQLVESRGHYQALYEISGETLEAAGLTRDILTLVASEIGHVEGTTRRQFGFIVRTEDGETGFRLPDPSEMIEEKGHFEAIRDLNREVLQAAGLSKDVLVLVDSPNK